VAFEPSRQVANVVRLVNDHFDFEVPRVGGTKPLLIASNLLKSQRRLMLEKLRTSWLRFLECIHL
jgi:hypothetical protein